MKRQAIRRQLAACLLSVLTLVAFSGPLLADCPMSSDQKAPATTDDCHESAVSHDSGDCPHHLVGHCAEALAGCDSSDEALKPIERKADWEEPAEPAALPEARLSQLPAQRRSPSPSLHHNEYFPASQGSYLRYCRFLE